MKVARNYVAQLETRGDGPGAHPLCKL